MNLNDAYVSLKQAKLLKEKGFPQKVCNSTIDIAQPSLYLVHNWLIEEKNIFIDVLFGYHDGKLYFYCNLISLSNYVCKHVDCTQRFKSYGEALSAGIDKALLYI